MGLHLDEDETDEVSDDVYARRAQARQRQITIGKSRPEYKVYASAVPFHRRTESMPLTPDPHSRISKRAFDRELACWRRGLHVCAAQLGGQENQPPKTPLERYGNHHQNQRFGKDTLKWADVSPAVGVDDWSPASTESTRADSEVSSPMRSHCQTPGIHAGEGVERQGNMNNVKLNLFEHLSPVVHSQSTVSSSSPVNMPVMQPMMPTVPAAGTWDMFAAGSMVGVMPGQGTAPSTAMLPLGPAEQQQCSYNMPFVWGEPMQPWSSIQQGLVHEATQSQQQFVPQMQLVDTSVGMPDSQAAGQMIWSSVGSQQQMLDTPRTSKWQPEESPSTPPDRVVKSVSSPAAPSPWIGQRTPSPAPCHYNMSQFKATMAQQPEVAVAAEADIWAASSLMVMTQNYDAEGKGYLSLSAGTEVRAMIDNPHCGDGDGTCAWRTYVLCAQGSSTGWVPQQLLWRCYVDESGRHWACDDATRAWCWVDEMVNNKASSA
jgi:hypothetical protein